MSGESDRLDDLLARDPYLDDGGFTERVMARLGPPRRDPRPVILGVSAAVALALAALWLPAEVRAALAALASLRPALGAAPALVLAGVAATAALAVAALGLVGEE
ncbi:MAG TPA: hypothetical protein VML50_08335 [Anaeromyxobacter sp.]|nr:hypothetical protein [Anaeromyxobacter sp.]